jgi:hypothetical protein
MLPKLPSKMPGNFIEITKSDISYDEENKVDIMDHVLEKDELDALLRALSIVEPDKSDKEEAYHYYKVTAEELLEALHYLCKLYCVDRGTWIRKLGRTTMFIDLLFDHTPQEIMKIYNDFIKEDNINEEES